MRFDFAYLLKSLGWMGGLLYLADVGWFAYDGSNIDYCLAFLIGIVIKKWVKAKIVKPSMIEDSEENQKGKTIEQLSPLTTYVNELKRRAIQKQQDDEAYF